MEAVISRAGKASLNNTIASLYFESLENQEEKSGDFGKERVEIVEEVASNSSKENEFDCCWVPSLKDSILNKVLLRSLTFIFNKNL
ncbi:hypothetical protein POPTR_011G164750v4 [Populus trichocarpa]|uniref:Uncharacterized protein n=1 Tax=Populus trichocarpa TaxID=3694 RepID=A0ACC0SAP9_POPTR|nr:hypothetical protein BDE02_11G144100 [Populus trichocarpa]KAI9386202.1 hypothetical protein POPTR_011G164750v4 [Populus trichocarpa]